MTQFIRLQYDKNKTENFFRRLFNRFEDNFLPELERIARDTQEYMKQNAPWEDQSYAARKSLVSFARKEGTRYVLTAEYDEDTIISEQEPQRNRNYSVFLEGYLNRGILDQTAEYIIDRVAEAIPKAVYRAREQSTAQSVPVYPYITGEPRDVSF